MESFKEFTINSRSENFRIGKINPIEILSFIKVDVGRKNELDQTLELTQFALEHIEVKVAESWVPVKAKKAQVYMPLNIEFDLTALAELDQKFQELVYQDFFQKSSE